MSPRGSKTLAFKTLHFLENSKYILTLCSGSCQNGSTWVYKGDLTGVYANSSQCSGVGTCNAATGRCECDDGFAGDACEKGKSWHGTIDARAS